MPIWIVKNSNTWKVYQVTNTGQRVTKGTFPLTKKSLANNLKKQLLSEEINNPVSANERVTFDKGFNEYLKNLDNEVTNNIITDFTAKGYKSLINYHVRPYINKIYLDEYLISDFNEHYIPKLNVSMSRASNMKGQIISFKAYKDTIATFKRAIKFWRDRKYNIGTLKEILDYQIRKGIRNNNQTAITKKEFYITKEDVFKLIIHEKSNEYKLMYQLAYESGARAEEIMAACFEDFDYKNNIWSITHSVNNHNIFVENRTKTSAGQRQIQLTPEIIKLINAWKLININPKRECEGKYTRLFKAAKTSPNDHIQATAKRAGVIWEGGLSPFRKLSSSLVWNSGTFDQKDFCKRHGWETMPVFIKHYMRSVSTKNQAANVESIFGFDKNEVALITNENVNAKNDKTDSRRVTDTQYNRRKLKVN